MYNMDIINPIMAIAKTNSCDLGVAKDMFTTNVELKDAHYGGADFDYSSDISKADIDTAFDEFMADYNAAEAAGKINEFLNGLNGKKSK